MQAQDYKKKNPDVFVKRSMEMPVEVTQCRCCRPRFMDRVFPLDTLKIQGCNHGFVACTNSQSAAARARTTRAGRRAARRQDVVLNAILILYFLVGHGLHNTFPSFFFPPHIQVTATTDASEETKEIWLLKETGFVYHSKQITSVYVTRNSKELGCMHANLNSAN